MARSTLLKCAQTHVADFVFLYISLSELSKSIKLAIINLTISSRFKSISSFFSIWNAQGWCTPLYSQFQFSPQSTRYSFYRYCVTRLSAVFLGEGVNRITRNPFVYRKKNKKNPSILFVCLGCLFYSSDYYTWTLRNFRALTKCVTKQTWRRTIEKTFLGADSGRDHQGNWVI